MFCNELNKSGLTLEQKRLPLLKANGYDYLLAILWLINTMMRSGPTGCLEC